jgi:hypothetical protein
VVAEALSPAVALVALVEVIAIATMTTHHPNPSLLKALPRTNGPPVNEFSN